jgi:hypothetical protein
MRKASVVVAWMLLAAVTAWAQNQLATVTSSAPFTLRGATVTPGQGVPTWPVLSGDGLTAGNALTIVTFPDGSVLTLSPGSEAKIDVVNGRPVFQLLTGTMTYSLKSTSAVQLMAGNQTVTPKGLIGTLTAGGSSAVVGGLPAAHTGAILLGAGVAVILGAAGVGIYEATKGGPLVSPL